MEYKKWLKRKYPNHWEPLSVFLEKDVRVMRVGVLTQDVDSYIKNTIFLFVRRRELADCEEGGYNFGKYTNNYITIALFKCELEKTASGFHSLDLGYGKPYLEVK